MHVLVGTIPWINAVVQAGRFSDIKIESADQYLTVWIYLYDVEEIGYDVLTASSKEESSSSIQKRVSAAWVIQKERFAESSTIFNGRMTKSEVEQYCQLDAEGQRLMKKAYSAFSLTGRSYFKILKTARTIADLEQSPDIRARHLEEALYFRQKEKGNLNER